MKKLIIFGDLLRVKQWAKNTFVFFPLIFSGRFGDAVYFMKVIWSFWALCFIASSVYIINDLIDLERDRVHHVKSRRPLASGKISKSLAVIIAGILLVIGLLLSYYVGTAMLNIAFAYICLHLLYNVFTKKMIFLDVITIAIGFQLRIWAGSVATGVNPSEWLQICVFLLALFLGFAKRRHEIFVLADKAKEHRHVLKYYSEYLLDQAILICATSAVCFYGLYTMSADIWFKVGNHMFYSIVFVIYGIYRYLYLIHGKKRGGDPGEILFSDVPLFVNIVLWIFYSIVVIYII